MCRLLSFVLFTGILFSCNSPETGTLWDSNKDLYMAARKAVLYQALNSPESARELSYALIQLDLYPPVDTVLKMISDPDESTREMLDNIARAYDNLKPIRKAENAIIDIWEGHDILPEVAEETQNSWGTAQACLTDNENYRPIMSDFRLDDPASATGIAGSPIPAFNIKYHDPLLNIRAMWSELDAFLQINLIE